MFEIGARVQVVRRGSLFAVRAQRLHELYRTRPDIAALTEAERDWLRTQVFGRPLDEILAMTREFWARRDPAMIARAEGDPRLMLALLFRWYLGMSCRWAIENAADRQADFQIWCGPAMGAFNAWARGTRFAEPDQRSAPAIAAVLMEDAARQLGAVLRPAPAAAAPSIRDWLIAQIAHQTKVPAEEIDPRLPFESFAMDSTAALMVLGRLERHLGKKLSPTVMWNYPTIDALSDWLEAG
jgi:acyl carrier protein